MQVHNTSSLLSQFANKSAAGGQPSNAANPFPELFGSVIMQNTSVDSSEQNEEKKTSTTYEMDVGKGRMEIDLDEYLQPKPLLEGQSLEDIPLLLPSEHNVNTLSRYSEQKFKALLAQYNIPEPPKTIEFDQEGKLVLPNDYPFAKELKQALKENPLVEDAMRTTAAVASHYAGIQEAMRFNEEMSTARNQADRDRIIAKHSHLFDDEPNGKNIILNFLDDGSLLLSEKP